MDDRLDDRFADAVRGALRAEVRATAPERSGHARPPRAPRRRFELVLAGVVAAVAVLAIVLGALSFAGLTKRADPAGPGYRQPVQPFDGDCDAVLSSTAVTGFAGTGVRRVTTDLLGDGADSLQLPLAGAMRCDWSGRSEADADAGLSLVVASADLPGARTRDAACYSGDSGRGSVWSCAFDVVDGRTWFSGILTTAPGVSKRSTTSARDDLLDALAARAGLARAALPALSGDAWARRSCDGLGARAGLPRALATPGLTTAQGNGPGQVSTGFVAAGTWSRETHCYSEDDGGDGTAPFLDFRALPDGAWLEDAVARRSPDPAPAADGVRTYMQQVSGAAVSGPDSIVVWAFDGPNALRVEAVHTTETQARAAAIALLGALDRAR